ncbi:MAG TPA: beta-propeller domain-containing protein [Micromonosporaceae bacterium]|nr:beta-propeller domain-containing protein [Micromonosporaceae bacterium]
MTTAAKRLAAGAVLLALAGCTSGNGTARPVPPRSDAGVGPLRLVSFDDCADLVTALRAAAREHVGPYGFGGGGMRAGVAEDAVAAGSGQVSAAGGDKPPAHSGTNTHEAGTDEPDLVKTDGRRIVTVVGGTLRVVDAATRRVTGALNLDTPAYAGSNLLLAGDRALVLLPERWDGDTPTSGGSAGVADRPFGGGPGGRAELLLVDLTGTPKVLSRYAIDGSMLDARQVGNTARVVIRSAPRIQFPDPGRQDDVEGRTRANQAAVDRATAADWLPRFRVETAGKVTEGRVDCAAVSRPTTYSGASMLTILTFDLGSAALGAGDPVSLVADGDTVYGTGSSLYVATDTRWMAPARVSVPRSPAAARTEVYRFDTGGTGKPRFAASGEVGGWLLNQYALSEWNGHLRVATTTGNSFGMPDPGDGSAPRPSPPQSESTVYVLRQDRDRLVERGRVGGLGRGEQIHGVRFAGAIGYVVTFRQTDPLYTLDLRDPATPKVAGELKITGYSAYLHPAGEGRLLGVGQEATTAGRRTGSQISLFDVANLATPTVLARHEVREGHSEAEFDPHAFLYWAQTGLLVVPMMSYQESGRYRSAALVLSVSGGTIRSLGRISHGDGGGGPEGRGIRRSLIIGEALWTVSEQGLKVNDATTVAELGWVPFG